MAVDDLDVNEMFGRFLQEPTRENYLAVFDAVMNSPDFGPYGSDLDAVEQLLEEGEFVEAIERGYEMEPRWLLSPRLHLLLSVAHARSGDAKAAEMERMIASRCVEGIENTGDGSEKSPYLVTSTADEYDVLGARGWKLRRQSLHHVGEGHFDVIECEGGEKIWFDITRVYEKLG